MIVKERNSVHEMVDALKRIGPMTENEIQKAAFGYDRNGSSQSNKKYADMLRRGMLKGIIDRVELKNASTRTKFIYFATKPEIQIECSAALDNEWANESM